MDDVADEGTTSNGTVSTNANGHRDTSSLEVELQANGAVMGLQQVVTTCETSYKVELWYNQNTPADVDTDGTVFTISVDGNNVTSFDPAI